MTPLHRTPLFLSAYRFLPHRLLNHATAQLARAERPRWMVQKAIRTWIESEDIDLADFEERDYRTVEEFFLRRLKPGARPIGDGLVSPVDGQVVDVGEIASGHTLMVKGRPISVERLVNGRLHALPLDDYLGGHYVVIFLSPRGYHYVHLPETATIEHVQWLPGRFFPQNDDALEHIDAVYERNERAVLALSTHSLLVMVGASLVGGIRVTGGTRKGDELGHFTFGSTVVLLYPRGALATLDVVNGQRLRMGQSIATRACCR